MVRRTISLPEGTEALVRKLALEGESFSATVTRLIEAGADTTKGYIGEPVETPGGWRLIVDEARYRDAIDE